MFWNFVDKAGRVLVPVLWHYLVSMIIGIWATTVGLHADAAFLTCLAALVVLPLFLWMYRKDQRMGMTARTQKIGLPECLLAAALGVLCNLVMTLAVNVLFLYLPASLRGNLSNASQEALFGSRFLMQLVGIGIIVPIMEEVLFRGLVYNRLTGYTKNVWALLGGAAIFALYHGNVIQILFAFPMGIVLILLYRKKQNLAAPVIFHMAVNISSILMAAYAIKLW